MEIEYFRNITDRMKILKNSIERDVNELVEAVLKPLAIFYGLNGNRDPPLPQELERKIRGFFTDVYWTLRLHLFLHLENPLDISRILEVGEWGGLSTNDMRDMGDQHFNHFTDPGSNLLELLSYHLESTTQRGSKKHATDVLALAKLFLGHLQAENIFLPDVLVMVEHVPTEKFFVGASIAVFTTDDCTEMFL
ncbi:uncharacterized protein LOC111328273 isoform X2 [Stylophora pistillata]|uniref:uncharacterized protein LOC111328273 isoform X2 n=1 Tax=Stylophora pistillata TaxID=50429 RepID=UPI000C05582E|nr:uncharacterized protein LOC111328273 isoform X2 [Stylophora pistillata]